MVATVESTKAEEGEASTSASQPTASKGSMLRKAPIKTKTLIPNIPTTVEDMLSEVPAEKSTPAKDDKTFLTISTPSLPIKQTIRLIGRILSIFKILLYHVFCYALYYGVLALVAIYAFEVLLTVVKSTVCTPPVLRRNLPFCGVKINPSSHVEFEKLGNLQAMLEEMHEATAWGITLPLLMKRGENAVREVAMNVELSNIPSRNEIGKKLREFQKRANIAGDHLRAFNSHLDRTMDSIISTNEWTARTLGEIAQEGEIENGRGAIGAFVNKGVALFEGSKPSTEEAVRLQYLRHLSYVKDDIDVLTTEAGLSAMNLDALENILWSVKKIGKHDLQDISKNKAKASSRIAAIFGLNWEEIEDLEEQSKVVLELLEQKDVAFASITGILSHLKNISAGLGDLKERAAMSGRPQAQKVPLSVQIDTFHRGLQRLERGRERTRQKKDRYLKEIRDQIP